MAVMSESASGVGQGEARGVLAEAGADRIVMTIPGTSYQLHLIPTGPVGAAVGKRLVGVIRANARRLDVTHTGGKYIEPVYGRPRRVQGSVVAMDAAAGTVTIDASVPLVLKVHPTQRADRFKPGDFVACDVEPGATFTQSTT
ncbi:MAG: hypothetical protein IBJ11_06585 [Phycisphaerales bacterium]|nr:hypothetical protein [Phycisphaerales bacterium]